MRIYDYAKCAWRFFALQSLGPLIYGIALTDRCNLSCRGCHVANTTRRDMSWDELVPAMQDAWARGFRVLYFTGGEPMLWCDADKTLGEAVAEAKRIGFFHVHVYTNGLLGLGTSADLFWVSMDGLPRTFETRRGSHFAQVERVVRSASHPSVAIVYVIDRNTADGIEAFLHWVRDTRFPVLGVMFYFHTPYYGRDELHLPAEGRSPIVDRLLSCVRAGLPVINSRAGLLLLKSGNWPRRSSMSAVLDIDGESVCCRASSDVCVDCGYAACAEVTAIQRLYPSALLSMRRFW